MTKKVEYSLTDAANDFCTLSNNVGRFMEEIAKEIGIKLEIGAQNQLLITLSGIQENLLSLVCYIRPFMKLQNMLELTNGTAASHLFLEILNIGIKDPDRFEKTRVIYKFPIESLITMIHFQIDSFFGWVCENILNKLHSGFFPRSCAIYKKLYPGSKNKPTRDGYRNTLECLACFRNSFHNRGIHIIYEAEDSVEIGHLDKTFTSEGFTIEFKHKTFIEYNWKSAYLLISESVKVLQNIMDTLVQQYKTEINQKSI